MNTNLNWVATGVFVFFFLVVAVMGFLSAHWQRGDLSKLDEWGLGGRRFGVLITWFLLGGDFYTAYTIIAVPAFVYGAGAIGFFALPYTILVYPFVFVVMPRLWSVSKRHNYITLADFARGRYGSRTLALAIAITGILATMPYIALQLVGLQVTIAALGLHGSAFVNDLPLIVAFLVLAAFAYTSGLRAPASIALVKDTMVYIFVLSAVALLINIYQSIPLFDCPYYSPHSMAGIQLRLLSLDGGGVRGLSPSRSSSSSCSRSIPIHPQSLATILT